jgi:large subunit ribosomal protein L24
MAKLKIKKGDTVYVLAGDDKGKTGRVLNILPEEGKAIVEGVNIVSKSTKPNAKAPQGGIIKKEAPIHLSNLAVVDPKSGRDPKPTRVGFRKDENGKTVRYSKKTGEEIK